MRVQVQLVFFPVALGMNLNINFEVHFNFYFNLELKFNFDILNFNFDILNFNFEIQLRTSDAIFLGPKDYFLALFYFLRFATVFFYWQMRLNAQQGGANGLLGRFHISHLP